MLRDLKEDEEESEQPPAIAAIGSRPPSEGSASPPAFGFAGLGPRPPSPPLGRADEELRMLERFQTLEHILPEEILSGPVAGIQLRRGAPRNASKALGTRGQAAVGMACWRSAASSKMAAVARGPQSPRRCAPSYLPSCVLRRHGTDFHSFCSILQPAQACSSRFCRSY